MGRRDDVDTHQEEEDGRHSQNWNDRGAYHASLSRQKKASGPGRDDDDHDDARRQQLRGCDWTFLFLPCFISVCLSSLGLGSGLEFLLRMNASG